jgi:predicted nuclease with TOPRIM domain
VASDRIKEITSEMSRLVEQQKKMLGSATKLLDMSAEVVDEYFQRYERLRQLARELGTMV